MSASIDLTDDDVFTALRTFILSLLPTVEVVQTQDNGVPMPVNPFITMNNVGKKRLATNTVSYTDPGGTAGGTENMMTPTQFTIQVDCYGPNSGDWAAMIQTAFRSEYATSNFPVNIQPLYCDDPVQIPLITGEQQFLQRWKLQAVMQYNPTVAVPMQFWDTPTPIGFNPIF